MAFAELSLPHKLAMDLRQRMDGIAFMNTHTFCQIFIRSD
jgi:hypothetical protein